MTNNICNQNISLSRADSISENVFPPSTHRLPNDKRIQQKRKNSGVIFKPLGKRIWHFSVQGQTYIDIFANTHCVRKRFNCWIWCMLVSLAIKLVNTYKTKKTMFFFQFMFYQRLIWAWNFPKLRFQIDRPNPQYFLQQVTTILHKLRHDIMGNIEKLINAFELN